MISKEKPERSISSTRPRVGPPPPRRNPGSPAPEFEGETAKAFRELSEALQELLVAVFDPLVIWLLKAINWSLKLILGIVLWLTACRPAAGTLFAILLAVVFLLLFQGDWL